MGCGANTKAVEEDKNLRIEAERKTAELRGLVERSDHESRRFETERDRARSDLVESQTQLRLVQKQLEEAQAKLGEETARLSRLETTSSAREGESRALRDELLAANATKVAEQKAAEKHRLDAGARDSALAELRVRASQLAGEKQGLTAERDALMAERDRAREELQIAKSEAAEAQSEAKAGRTEALAAKSEAKTANAAASAAASAARQAVEAVRASKLVVASAQASPVAQAAQTPTTPVEPNTKSETDAVKDTPLRAAPPRRSGPRSAGRSTLRANINGGAPLDDPGANFNPSEMAGAMDHRGGEGSSTPSAPAPAPNAPIPAPSPVQQQPPATAAPKARPSARAKEVGEAPKRTSRLSQRRSTASAGGRAAKAKGGAAAKSRPVAAPWDADDPSSSEDGATQGKGSNTAQVPPAQRRRPRQNSKVTAPWDAPDSDGGGLLGEPQGSSQQPSAPAVPSRCPPAPASSSKPEETNQTAHRLSRQSRSVTPSPSAFTAPPPPPTTVPEASKQEVARRIRPSPRRVSESIASEAPTKPPPRENPSAQVFRFDFTVFDFLRHEALQSPRGMPSPIHHRADFSATSGRCGPSASSASTAASSSSPMHAVPLPNPPARSPHRSAQDDFQPLQRLAMGRAEGRAAMPKEVRASRDPSTTPPAVADNSDSSVAGASEIWDPDRGMDHSLSGLESDVPSARGAKAAQKRCP